MEINVEDIRNGKYKSLKQFTEFIESRADIADDDFELQTRLRFAIFKKWHDERGFSPEDAKFVLDCSFKLEMFTDEDNVTDAQIKNDTNEYRKHRNDSIRQTEQYAADILRKSKKKGKIAPENLHTELVEIHKKEREIATQIFRAKKALERNQRYQENVVITTESIAHQVLLQTGKGNLKCSMEELHQYIEQYEEKGEYATISLRMSSEELLKKADSYIEKNQKKIITWTLVGITGFNSLLLCIRFLMCIATLDRVVVSNNTVYIMLSLIISAIAWVYSTTQDYFNFYNIKWRMLIMVLANDAATLLQLFYTFLWNTVVVTIFKIPTNELFTENMVVNFARIAVTVGLAIGIAAAYKLIKPFITAEEAKEKILAFKLRHIADNRENKEFKYDFCVIKDLKTGKPILIKEHDLYTHILLLGASGTGKTSSIYIPQVIENIRKKQKNLEMQQREVLRLVQTGKVEITQPFSKDKFGRQYFKATSEEAQAKLDAIFETYKECGITVVAPNNSMNEDILSYTSGRGIWVNNLDPSKKKATHPYERLVGMNPFYMPPKYHEIEPTDLDAEEERTIYIAESTNNFADALAAINELNGSADPYFTDVNTTVTSSIATVIMLHASIKGTQVTIDDVNNCIQDFGLLPAYIADVKRHFNIKYVNQNPDPKSTKKESAKIRRVEEDNEEEEQKMRQEIYEKLTDEDRKNPYIQTIITCESRLWKGSTMDTHAEGLRNLIRKLLQDPRIKRILVNNKDILDFNEILSDNAITVVNTALEFGKNTSTCFGQLFLLNFNSAVLRRPKHLRSPHFLYEDETARYLSDTIDTMVTLYRQFGVSCAFALQTLEQVEKVPHLRYLRNSLLSAGTIISFGRASYTDAKTISELGGQERYQMVQKTTSYKSIFDPAAASSFSERTTPDTKNYVDPHDVRYRDFQECTVLYTDEGHVLPAKLGKAFFVPKEVLFGVEQKQIDQNNTWRMIWRSRYPLTEDVITVNPDSTIAPTANLEAADLLKNNATGSVLVHKNSRDTIRNIISDKSVDALKDMLSVEKNEVEQVLDTPDTVAIDTTKKVPWVFSDEIDKTKEEENNEEISIKPQPSGNALINKEPITYTSSTILEYEEDDEEILDYNYDDEDEELLDYNNADRGDKEDEDDKEEIQAEKKKEIVSSIPDTVIKTEPVPATIQTAEKPALDIKTVNNNEIDMLDEEELLNELREKQRKRYEAIRKELQ